MSLHAFTQLPRATNPWDYKTVACRTVESPLHRKLISSTPPDSGDWVKSSAVAMLGPGAHDTGITTNGWRWTLVDQRKSRKLKHKDDRIPTNGWQDTRLVTVRMELTGPCTDIGVLIRYKQWDLYTKKFSEIVSNVYRKLYHKWGSLGILSSKCFEFSKLTA